MAIEQTDNSNFVEGLFTHYADEVWLKGNKVVRLQASIDDAGTSFLDVDPLGVQQGTGQPGVGARIRLTEEGIRLSVGENVSIDLNREAGITLRCGAYALTLNEDGFNVVVGAYLLRLTETGFQTVVGDNVLGLLDTGLAVTANTIELEAAAAFSIETPDLNVLAEGTFSIVTGLMDIA